MIQIHINPARVDKVLFIADSDVEEDFDLAAWQAIRPLIEKIDRRLRRAVKGTSTRDILRDKRPQPRPKNGQDEEPWEAAQR